MPVIQNVDFHKQRIIVRVKEVRTDALRELETNVELVRPLVVREALTKKDSAKAMEVADDDNMVETNN